jgi:cytochrome b561
MSVNRTQFPAFSRVLHWLMAVIVLAMLFIGIGMASSVSERYRFLVAIHRPLGLAILVLVAARLVNRLLNPPPPLPGTIPPGSASPPRHRTSCCTR